MNAVGGHPYRHYLGSKSEIHHLRTLVLPGSSFPISYYYYVLAVAFPLSSLTVETYPEVINLKRAIQSKVNGYY